MTDRYIKNDQLVIFNISIIINFINHLRLNNQKNNYELNNSC